VRQREAGTALLLAPGGVQIFYGDESGRRLGPAGSDATQGTRSGMNWADLETASATAEKEILEHWKRLGAFRKRHPAVGAGAHQRLASPDGTYAFSRTVAGGDAVVVVVTRPR
jgi:alpha-amylase